MHLSHSHFIISRDESGGQQHPASHFGRSLQHGGLTLCCMMRALGAYYPTPACFITVWYIDGVNQTWGRFLRAMQLRVWRLIGTAQCARDNKQREIHTCSSHKLQPRPKSSQKHPMPSLCFKGRRALRGLIIKGMAPFDAHAPPFFL